MIIVRHSAANPLPCRLDLPGGLSLGVDRVADRRVAFIKQRWTAGPYRNSSSAAASYVGLQGKCSALLHRHPTCMARLYGCKHLCQLPRDSCLPITCRAVSKSVTLWVWAF